MSTPYGPDAEEERIEHNERISAVVEEIAPAVREVLHRRARRWFTLFLVATAVATAAAIGAWKATDGVHALRHQLEIERSARATAECEIIADGRSGLRHILIGIEGQFGPMMKPELRAIFDEALSKDLAPVSCAAGHPQRVPSG